jgi:hypothetical protein
MKKPSWETRNDLPGPARTSIAFPHPPFLREGSIVTLRRGRRPGRLLSLPAVCRRAMQPIRDRGRQEDPGKLHNRCSERNLGRSRQFREDGRLPSRSHREGVRSCRSITPRTFSREASGVVVRHPPGHSGEVANSLSQRCNPLQAKHLLIDPSSPPPPASLANSPPPAPDAPSRRGRWSPGHSATRGLPGWLLPPSLETQRGPPPTLPLLPTPIQPRICFAPPPEI